MITIANRMARFGILCTALILAACSSPDIREYADARPSLALERYFDGTVDAWGLVLDRSGAVTRRFTVTIEGTWQGERGQLDERFVYADGERQTRIWNIERTGEGRYVGRADDVIGSATGQAAGNALNWAYTLRVPVDDTTYDIDFDDWMFLVDEHTLINRAVMTKFGIRVGEVLITFRRRSAS